MVYLHIGAPRTASSFLQDIFFPSVEGVNYIDDPIVMDAVYNCLYSQKFSKESEHVIRSMTESQIPVLLSSEAFSMKPWAQTYPSKISRLRQLIPDSEIIVFLRDPVNWVLSLYALAIQKHRYISLADFVRWNGEKFINSQMPVDRKSRLDVKNLSVFSMLDIWNKSYLPERVHVFFYENFAKQPDKELTRLSDLIGGTIPENFNSGQRRNSSSTAERCDAAAAAYSYLGRLDRFTKHWSLSHKIGPGLAYRIVNGQIPFPKLLVRSQRGKIRAALEIEFREDKERIAKMYPDCPW